jgi:glycine/D-amino acid oxidase-like deaminating enzyme
MHVVVIGSGVFGAWTAHHLHARGAEVTLIDAYGPAHSRSSSGDETRIVRCGYGPDAIYSEMARRSLVQWRELDARTGGADRLWHAAGVLWMAAGTDAYTAATLDTLTRLREPFDRLSSSDLQSRFPQFNTDGIDVALFERECGVVAARRAVRALVADLANRGVRVTSGRIAAPSEPFVRSLHAQGAADMTGDRFVFACGAWLPGLFPAQLSGRIRPTRQVVTYFGTPSGDSRFTAPRMPAWVDFPSGIYGTPDIDGRGVKVGVDEHGDSIDPDVDDRLPDPSSLAQARAWLARRVPALARAPIVETRVCAYENTATGDFLIDRHPAHDNVWIVGGGSGHGFKHGPAVGELAARMVLDGDSPDARFAIASKTTGARRTIY